MSVNSSVYDVLRAPVITEKSQLATTHNKYTFEVAPDADKGSIAKAVEAVFNVTVDKVNTVQRKGKVKRFRGTVGKRKNNKIAVVTLAKGSAIDFDGNA